MSSALDAAMTPVKSFEQLQVEYAPVLSIEDSSDEEQLQAARDMVASCVTAAATAADVLSEAGQTEHQETDSVPQQAPQTIFESAPPLSTLGLYESANTQPNSSTPDQAKAQLAEQVDTLLAPGVKESFEVSSPDHLSTSPGGSSTADESSAAEQHTTGTAAWASVQPQEAGPAADHTQPSTDGDEDVPDKVQETDSVSEPPATIFESATPLCLLGRDESAYAQPSPGTPDQAKAQIAEQVDTLLASQGVKESFEVSSPDHLNTSPGVLSTADEASAAEQQTTGTADAIAWASVQPQEAVPASDHTQWSTDGNEDAVLDKVQDTRSPSPGQESEVQGDVEHMLYDTEEAALLDGIMDAPLPEEKLEHHAATKDAELEFASHKESNLAVKIIGIKGEADDSGSLCAHPQTAEPVLPIIPVEENGQTRKSWFSCIMCSRRTSAAPKRKMSDDIEVGNKCARTNLL